MREIIIEEVTVIRFAATGEAIIVDPRGSYHPATHIVDLTESSFDDKRITLTTPEWHREHAEDLVTEYDVLHTHHNGW